MAETNVMIAATVHLADRVEFSIFFVMCRALSVEFKNPQFPAMGFIGEDFAMSLDQIMTEHCAILSSLAVGPTPGARHVSLLASYRLLRERGREATRSMIVADIRDTLD